MVAAQCDPMPRSAFFDCRRSTTQCSNAFSDRSNFGEPLDCVLVVPADGGFPCGRRLRGDVVRAVVEAGGVVGQYEVEVGDVDVRLVQRSRCPSGTPRTGLSGASVGAGIAWLGARWRMVGEVGEGRGEETPLGVTGARYDGIAEWYDAYNDAAAQANAAELIAL